MTSSKPSASVARIAAATAVCAVILGAVQLQPMVRLGYSAAGIPAPRGPLAVANREISIAFKRADGQGMVAVPIHLWHPVTAPAVAGYPLIVYAPVWAETRFDNTGLLASVASHGFVVAAIDDIHRDPEALDLTPADTEVRNTLFDFSGSEGRTRMLASFDRRIELQATKLSHVLDALISNRAQLPAAAAFDPMRIGMLGASFGGASAVEAGLTDNRVRAVVNLDGWLRGKATTRTLEIPLANFNSTRGVPDQAKLEAPNANPNQAFVAARNRETTAVVERQIAARADARDITIAGASHGDFNGELYDPQRWRQWRPWRRNMIAPARMHEILDAHIAAFFSTHLDTNDGSGSASTVAFGLQLYPEVTIRLGRGPALR